MLFFWKIFLQTLHVLKGSMDSIMYIKGGGYLGLPFSLDVKGGESLVVVVAIKSKRGDCWHYDSSIVLDGNPLVAEQLTCIW